MTSELLTAPRPTPRRPKASADGRPHVARPRRSHADRSAESRARLIEATIDCLHRLGYSAASTNVVAEAAGVSRGRMTHQFPTKLDLMEAVVRKVFNDELEVYANALEARSAEEAFYAWPEIMWEVASRPGAIAVTEIMMATRSDAALANRFRAVQTSIEDIANARMIQLMKDAGVAARPDGRAIHRMFVAAIRGLAIDALWAPQKDELDDVIGSLQEVMSALYPRSMD